MALSRRRFLKSSAVATAGVGFSLSTNAKVLGANDRLNVAVVGVNRGTTHMHWLYGESKNTQCTVSCDADINRAKSKANMVTKNWKNKCEAIQDYRRVVDRKDIDIVSVGTHNCTHAIISIQAMESGKDVYCEKPVSHNVWEGRQLVNAARRYNKICQTGTQSRSNKGMRDMIKYVESGQLGKVKYAVGTCYKSRRSIGKRSTPLTIAKEVDYNLWCGPAAKVPLYRNKMHYDWHWDFNTGNGDLGNQGIHQMDLARWFLGEKELSPRVISAGGRIGYEDAGNTPNTQVIYHDYKRAPLIFEVRGLPTTRLKGIRIGVVVECEGGTMLVGSYSAGRAIDKEGKRIKNFSGGGRHYGNFIDAVRKRDQSILTAEIEEGHLSSALCHTGNISHQLGKKATPDEIKAQFKGDAIAEDSIARMYEHCRANKVKIDPKTLTLGTVLEMDPKTERFTNSEAANKLLTREYRKPFVINAIDPKATAKAS